MQCRMVVSEAKLCRCNHCSCDFDVFIYVNITYAGCKFCFVDKQGIEPCLDSGRT